jgi:hypothetical protein
VITVVLVSLAAAGCFGLSSALQHAEVGRARRRPALHPGLLTEVARRPGWLLGALCQLTGVVLHLCAVNLGPLSVVQPVLTVGLVVALGVQRLRGRRVPDSALLASALVIIGLGVLLTASPGWNPAPSAAPQDPLDGGLFVGVVLLGALLAGLRGRGGTRAVALGAAAGTLMATSAAAAKVWGTILRTEGLPELLASRQLWAGLVLGFGGLLLSQAAFQTGPLGGPLAAMMAVDPVVGIGLGVIVFGEPLGTDGDVLRQFAGLLLTVLGVVLLARIQGAGTVDRDRPRATASASRA